MWYNYYSSSNKNSIWKANSYVSYRVDIKGRKLLIVWLYDGF